MNTAVAPPPSESESSPAPPARVVFEPELARPPTKRGGLVAGLILIGLGAAALAGNLLPTWGGLLFFGLGGAFLVARVATGQRGYAVPAGILLGFGTFVSLTESRFVAGREAGGLFFIFLGLGFMATYVIAADPRAVWPIVPASALIGFGLFVQGWLLAWPFEQLLWLAPYWPLVIILFGAWLLLRDQVPETLRGPLTIVGLATLVLVGFLVAAAGVATLTAPGARFAPLPVWPTMPMFGAPPVQDSVTMSAPLGSGEILRLSSTSGRITVRPTVSDQVRVEAFPHYWPPSGPPRVALHAVPGGLAVEVTQDIRGPGGGTGYIDYVVEVPSGAGVDVGSTSGDISVNALSGAMTLRATSGNLTLTDLSGPVMVESTSGRIRASGVERLVSARSVSGDIDLAGAFNADATVVSTSGDVTLRFEPDTSARIDASTLSGTIRTSGPGVPAGGEARSRSVTLGSGTVHIQVRTTSGSIALTSR